MSEMKHTPGPWWADNSRYGTIYIEANAVIDRRLVQEICAVGPTESGREQQDANARLIAAAPDLLEALIGLLQDTQHKDHNCGEFEYCPVLRAREVVAKATQP